MAGDAIRPATNVWQIFLSFPQRDKIRKFGPNWLKSCREIGSFLFSVWLSRPGQIPTLTLIFFHTSTATPPVYSSTGQKLGHFIFLKKFLQYSSLKFCQFPRNVSAIFVIKTLTFFTEQSFSSKFSHFSEVSSYLLSLKFCHFSNWVSVIFLKFDCIPLAERLIQGPDLNFHLNFTRISHSNSTVWQSPSFP